MLFLTAAPLWLSAGILVVLCPLLAMAGTVLARRRFGLARLKINNEVAGFKFAAVGVLYAVFLAFAVIVVWEKFNDAEHAVANEAGAAATIYRLSAGLDAASGEAVRAGTTAYLKSAIGDDWPAMDAGGASAATTRALDALYATVLGAAPGERGGAIVLAEILHQLDLITQARRDRLVMASGTVPDLVWFVLIVGALMTIGFTFFFGTENLRAQTLMTGALSVLIFSAMLIVVGIDHPFTGPVKVEARALSAVLADFGGRPRP